MEVMVGEDAFMRFVPAFYRRVEHGPLFGELVTFKTDAAQLARRAVDTVASDHPPCVHLISATIALDVRQYAPEIKCHSDKSRRPIHLASKFMQIVDKDGLGNLLGHSETEPVHTSAGGEVDRSEQFAIGVDLDDSLSAADVEELVDEPYGLEDLKRTRMNQCGAIPMHRPRPGIDQMAWNTTSLKLGGEEKTCRTCTNYENRCLKVRFGARVLLRGIGRHKFSGGYRREAALRPRACSFSISSTEGMDLSRMAKLMTVLAFLMMSDVPNCEVM